MVLTIFLLPLAAALIAGLTWRVITEGAAQWSAVSLMVLAATLSWIVLLTFQGPTEIIQIMRFIESGTLSVDWAIRLDRLTAIMLAVISTVTALVQTYAIRYMALDERFDEDEPHLARFSAYLSLLAFFAMVLVTGDNMVQLFAGWAGMGFAVYLLISFHYKRPSANAAALKAFSVGRVGELALLLAMAVLFVSVDSLRFDDMFATAPELSAAQMRFLGASLPVSEVVGWLFLVAAMARGAQVILHAWLADALDGPTPVTAMIVAIYLPSAVFVLARVSPLLEFAAGAGAALVVVGGVSAVVSASAATVQVNIKRALGLVCLAQIGVMIVAVGLGFYNAAMLHLLCLAFIAPLLMLAAGSVNLAMGKEQNLRSYGGLRHKMPVTFWMTVLGVLAITGVGVPTTVFGIGGFAGLQAILSALWAAEAAVVFALIIAAVSLTSLASWRVVFLTFMGAPRGKKDRHETATESGPMMLIAMAVLALAAVSFGTLWAAAFVGDATRVAAFFDLPGAADALPGQGALYFGADNAFVSGTPVGPPWLSAAVPCAMVLGFLLAMALFLRKSDLPKRLATAQPQVHGFLMRGWRLDGLDRALLIDPLRRFGTFLSDRVDGRVLNGITQVVAARAMPRLTRLLSRGQSGSAPTYGLVMIVGLAALVTWASVSGGVQ
ncbi:MAG: NADH-quinone oxidoreductase subunit L [Pseudomonadota bacterium]